MEELNLERFDKPLHILAVDDRDNNLTIIRSILQPAGCVVHTASSGEECLERVHEWPLDIVLLDVMMPGMDGFEVCRRLKADPRTRLVPVVLVTALRERRDRIRGIQAGCSDFLSKPIDRWELMARVHTLCTLKRLSDQLEQAESVVMSFARAVEAKDRTTGDHCDRLCRLCREFGSFLELDEDSLRTLEWASVLHDVGKIGVPDAVLLKQGRLSEAEWQTMRTHPAVGEEICRPLKSLSAVCPIIRHHHERWDGSGYPDGLAGRDIPYLARVFQIIDAFDSIISERPYKRAFTLEETLAILQKEAERQRWDPEVVEAFVRFVHARD